MNKEMISKVIKTWTMYGFNYEYQFIKKVFGDEGEMMVNHLQSKFDGYYESYGAAGAFFIFWAELDTKHKEKLEMYVMDNYKG